ncbi:alpha/beta fold hydrolase [Piscinibacter koreensis]|uniref:Alpha/beta hydrolase n=1 Tax=Piscinibacter koreensis TaxID=2742824 RepID=A0A7Y6TVB0_9BURK|nr:alpha/beta hydrolase [Schlegelella koreensis]NUZ04742.1 alpha/beta hydrolase [Schlegelella koreensis]
MSGPERVTLDLAGRRLEIEVDWVGPRDADRPLLVFLHEGLGSVAMWKDFPAALCDACGVRGLVYSRPGYGRSTPRAPGERWGVDFMHREAEQVLPALLDALGVDAPYALFGHSDGGSIALIHAARFAPRVSAAVVMAPHWVVEAFGLVSIRAAREAYEHGDLREKLAKYHADVDSAFYGWNDIWLNHAFESWTIESLLAQIACPVLAIQGTGDPYGTMRQIERIAEAVPATRLVKLAECGHSPHRDRPDAVIAATRDFLNQAITGRQR